MILVGRSVVILMAAVLSALPAAASADGIMLVQAGAFWMGRDDGPSNEAPQHRVYVRDFWIATRSRTPSSPCSSTPPASDRRAASAATTRTTRTRVFTESRAVGS